jgi:hypothetical protein
MTFLVSVSEIIGVSESHGGGGQEYIQFIDIYVFFQK